jgi:methionyl-tRNA formyltransferase
MGTPDFAVPTLAALDDHHQVVGVVTQPDRPAGRGRQLVASPAKGAALARHLPLYQPKSLQSPEALARLAEWQPEAIVVAAFGQLVPGPVLDLPPHGCLNIHPSLLPRHRGAAPVPAAILAGDAVTGVTVMLMAEGLDTGPILRQVECPIEPQDTAASLMAKLAELGAQLMLDTLPAWLAGRLEAQPQDESEVTVFGHLKKADGRLDWSQPAVDLDRRVRACQPWPGAFTTWQGKRLKVLRARPHPEWPGQAPPGTVVDWEPGLAVATGQGALELVEVQLAGKRPMSADVFGRGQRDLVGGRLGEE